MATLCPNSNSSQAREISHGENNHTDTLLKGPGALQTAGDATTPQRREQRERAAENHTMKSP